jgi:integrative and conjugative element protein (TIGR02256 family)
MSKTAWTDKCILEQAVSESDVWCPKETGGVLMGYWSGKDAVITTIIGAGPKAVHRRYSFTPDDQWHAKEIARVYEESGRVITYLGDWHSHPYGSPRLSIKDLATLFRIATHKPARAPKPIMGILHSNPNWELAIWHLALSRIGSSFPAATMKVAWYDEI